MRARSILVAAIAICVMALQPARAATVDLTISNFRYCAVTPQCTPAAQAYVSNQSGENIGGGAVSPAGTVQVRRGDLVRWTYNDLVCDALAPACFHQIIFSNGAFSDLSITRGSPISTFTIPAGAPIGTVYTYFCAVGNGLHARSGMTGALQVIS